MTSSRERAVRRTLILGTILGLSCADPPPAPSTSHLFLGWFGSRPYILEVRGYHAFWTPNGTTPACPGLTIPGVATDVEPVREGDRWYLRPLTAGGGNFNVRFDTVDTVFRNGRYLLRVVGSVTGTMVATRPVYPHREWRPDSLSFGSRGLGGGAVAPFEVFTEYDILWGTVTGDATFHASSGASFPCARGTPQFHVRPRAPDEPELVRE